MSVWKTAAYSDDALAFLVRNCNREVYSSDFVLSAADFEVGEFGSHVVPGGVQQGNLRSQLLRGGVDLRGLYKPARYNLSDSKDRLFASLGEATFGLKAVYRIAHDILRSTLGAEVAEQSDWRFVQEFHLFGLAASSHTARDHAGHTQALKTAIAGGYETAKRAILDLIRLRSFWRARSYQLDIEQAEARRQAWPKVEERSLGFFSNYEVYVIPGAVILSHPGTGKVCMLLASDIDRVEKVVMGIHRSVVYSLSYGAGSEDARRKFQQKVLQFAELMRDSLVSCKNPNFLCRAYDVVYHLLLAETCAPDDGRAQAEQRKKWGEEGLGDQLDQSLVRAAVAGLGMKEKLEVLLMYKCLPVADYDVFGAAYRQETMYRENQEAAIADGAATGDVFDEILLYMKWVMIVAYHRKHSVCPGFVKLVDPNVAWHATYPRVDPYSIDFLGVGNVDLNGEFVYKRRYMDILDITKDKAVCPTNIRDLGGEEDVRQLPVYMKNQLLDVMMRDVPINLVDVGRRQSSLFYDVKADDKPEAKKPGGRWFFEAATEARLKQSEYEESVAEYAKYAPGCFAGIPHEEKVRQMNAVTEPVDPALPYQQLYVSFDIKKFSPYLPVVVHKRLDALWAEAFGEPSILESSRIFTDGKIHYIKKGLHHSFDKLGVDFEGFAGRKLTMYHCAVMGYCVRQLRVEGVTSRSARFATLIDDGLLRILLDRRDFVDRKMRALEVIEKIYATAALRISWDKTYCSSTLGVFLHEIRVLGRSITPGLRAALKITNRSDEPVASLPADLQQLRATTHGAIVAGAPLMSCYTLYVVGFWDAIKRWQRSKAQIRAQSALLCFVPMALGGLSAESMVTLSGSVSHCSFNDSLGALKLIGFRYPMVRATITRYLSVAKRPLAGISGWLHPNRVITAGLHLRGDRLALAVERHLKKTLTAPVLRALLPALDAVGESYLELAMTEGAKIPVPARKTIYDASPQKAIQTLSAKFLRARSVHTLVPRKVSINIGYANREEAGRLVARMSRE